MSTTRLKITQTQSGQTLLEVTVALGIALVIITTLAITTLSGLRNSQFSKNQTQATKYAQEAIDAVRAIKDRNCPVTITGGLTYYWYDNASLIWNAGDLSSRIFIYNLSPCGLTEQASNETISGTIFSRKITIENVPQGPNDCINSTDCKKIRAEVSWSDISGSHSSNLVTILANY